MRQAGARALTPAGTRQRHFIYYHCARYVWVACVYTPKAQRPPLVSKRFLFEDLPKSLHVANQPNPAGAFQLVASNYNACLSIKWGRADARALTPAGTHQVYLY